MDSQSLESLDSQCLEALDPMCSEVMDPQVAGTHDSKFLKTKDPQIPETMHYQSSETQKALTVSTVPNSSEAAALSGDHSSSGSSIEPTAQSSKPNSSKKGKIMRPCPFCGKFKLCFASHLKNKHSDVEEVKKIQSMVSTSDRKKAYRKLLVRGIDIHNEKILRSNEPLLRLRKPKNDNPLKFKCNNCNMILEKTSMSRHKAACFANPPPRNVGTTQLVGNTLKKKTSVLLIPNFFRMSMIECKKAH